MKNYVKSDEHITLTVSRALSSGDAYLVGNLFGVAQIDIANGATGSFVLAGTFTLPKLSTDVVAIGDVLYWDDTNHRLTKTSTSNTKVGVAASAAGNGVTTVDCIIHGIGY